MLYILLHHSSELEYDWRERFGFGLRELVSDRISVAEAVALTKGVMADSGSHTFAAASDWNRPMNENTSVLITLLDRFTQVNSTEKPTPYPRPWVIEARRATAEEIERARAMLKARGPLPREVDG